MPWILAATLTEWLYAQGDVLANFLQVIYFAAFFAWTGDLKERVREHRLVRNSQANFLCELCMACRCMLAFNAYDFGPSAGWRSSYVDHDHYIETHHAGRAEEPVVQDSCLEHLLQSL